MLTESERKELQSRTGWSSDIVDFIDSVDEANIYIKAGLKEAKIGGKAALVRSDIAWSAYNCRKAEGDFKDPEAWHDYNNADLIGEGYPPYDDLGYAYELHHIGQKPNSPFAELTYNEHRGESGNFPILHHNFSESEIARDEFAKEKAQYWQDRFNLFTQKELDAIYNKQNTMEKSEFIFKKTHYSANTEKILKRLAIFQTVTSGSLIGDTIQTIKEIPSVEECFKAPSNSPSEKAMRKILAAATTIAAKKKILPIAQTPVAIAAAADNAFIYAKLAYQVGAGQIDAMHAVDGLIDRMAAKLALVAPQIVSQGINKVANAALMAVSSIYPPAKAFVPIAQTMISRVSNAAASYVTQKAIPAMTNVAKSAAHGIINKATGFASKVKHKIFG